MTASSLIRRKHNLPHWQKTGSVYFITFRSVMGLLSDEARRRVIDTVLYRHERDYILYFGVVMPDHVHLLLHPEKKPSGDWPDLGAMLKSIKGVSARQINALLSRKGKVWQAESFDRIVRDDREFSEKWNYMLHNPVKSGLVEQPEDDPFFIRPDDDFSRRDHPLLPDCVGPRDRSVASTGLVALAKDLG